MAKQGTYVIFYIYCRDRKKSLAHSLRSNMGSDTQSTVAILTLLGHACKFELEMVLQCELALKSVFALSKETYFLFRGMGLGRGGTALTFPKHLVALSVCVCVCVCVCV